MTMATETAPHLVMAKDFMARKGLGDLKPFDVDFEGSDAAGSLWYCYYRLPQGTLELEVYFDRRKDDWEVAVTAFPVAL